MKWKKTNEPFSLKTTYLGRKKNYLFKIYNINKYNYHFYICCGHNKKDIRFNSLWEKITFSDLEKAKEFCENFNYKNYKCLGKDKKDELKEIEKNNG